MRTWALSCCFLLACGSSTNVGPVADAGPAPAPSDAGDAATDAPPPIVDAGPIVSGACAKEHSGANADGDPLDVCDQPYATRPFVRPPADDVPSGGGAATLYLGLELSPKPVFFDRRGQAYIPVDQAGSPLAIVGAGGAGASLDLPAAMRMPSNRNLFTLYRVTGAIGADVDAGDGVHGKALRVADARPAIMLPGAAIDGAFLGPWEGWVSQRNTDGTWTDAVHVPLRVTFSKLEPDKNLDAWDLGGATLPDGQVSFMRGAIDNASAGVKGSDGTCFASLASLGENDPFYQATDATLSLERIGGMHGPGDQVTNVPFPAGVPNLATSGMGMITVLHPVNFLLTDGTIPSAGQVPWGEIEIVPHGTPHGLLVLRLHPVSGGGGGC